MIMKEAMAFHKDKGRIILYIFWGVGGGGGERQRASERERERLSLGTSGKRADNSDSDLLSA